MLRPDLVGFVIPGEGRTIEALQFGQYQLQLRLSGNAAIALEIGFTCVLADTTTTHVNPQADLSTQGAESAVLFALLGREVERLLIFDDGRLEIYFSDELNICTDEPTLQYSDWELWGFGHETSLITGESGLDPAAMMRQRNAEWETF